MLTSVGPLKTIIPSYSLITNNSTDGTVMLFFFPFFSLHVYSSHVCIQSVLRWFLSKESNLYWFIVALKKEENNIVFLTSVNTFMGTLTLDWKKNTTDT